MHKPTSWLQSFDFYFVLLYSFANKNFWANVVCRDLWWLIMEFLTLDICNWSFFVWEIDRLVVKKLLMKWFKICLLYWIGIEWGVFEIESFWMKLSLWLRRPVESSDRRKTWVDSWPLTIDFHAKVSEEEELQGL